MDITLLSTLTKVKEEELLEVMLEYLKELAHKYRESGQQAFQ
jgi:hypothetical protein